MFPTRGNGLVLDAILQSDEFIKTVTTKVGYGCLNIANRTREKSPSHDMSIMQSVSYRDRSLSRGRTHMDLEDPNGVSEWDIGLPTQLIEFQR